MVILIVGLGSMGKRRARLLRQTGWEISVLGVDTSETRRNDALNNDFDAVFFDIESACVSLKPSIAFVCTSPLSHFSVINTCLDNRMHVFSELNLTSEGYTKLINKARNYNLILFLSSTLLYRKDLDYIINTVKEKRVNYIYHVGQYLPDWHPWESYKNYFVSDKRTNACREILAIDLPWLIRAMGDVTNINVVCDKISQLDIDFPDNYFINLKHSTGSKGLLCVDIICRKPVRRLEIFSEEININWSGTPETLTSYNLDTREIQKIDTYVNVEQNNKYSVNIIENAYMDEIYSFISTIAGDGQPRYSFQDDINTIALIDRIEGRL